MAAEDEAGYRSLCREYDRLFKGPNLLQAPPWGSVYTDRDGVVFGESTLALRSWMRGEGIERSEEDNQPDDHFGKMLMLLSWLAENRKDLVVPFLKEHLLTWSHHYLVQLYAAAEMDFFKALARIADASLEGMRAALKIDVEYPHYFR